MRSALSAAHSSATSSEAASETHTHFITCREERERESGSILNPTPMQEVTLTVHSMMLRKRTSGQCLRGMANSDITSE